jgi:uncharacterized protein (DUF983 family)
MIRCPECDREISASAQSCPGCGARLQTSRAMLALWVVLGVGFALAVLGVVLWQAWKVSH